MKSNGVAIAIPKNLDRAGRTYKGRNRVAQIAEDAKDLGAAALKDIQWHLNNATKLGYSQSTIDKLKEGFDRLLEMNKANGVF